MRVAAEDNTPGTDVLFERDTFALQGKISLDILSTTSALS